MVAEAVERVAGVRTHLGKLKAWCRGGGPPPADFRALEEERARRFPASARDPVWRAALPAENNGLLVLGAPLGTAEYVAAQGRLRCDEERRLLSQLPRLEDLQAAWLLLSFCAGPRFNHWVRVVPPSLCEDYAREHDQAMWDTLRALLAVPPMAAQRSRAARALASLPGAAGGLGLRNADRTRAAAFWASWADALPVLQARTPDAARHVLERLEQGGAAPGTGLGELVAAAEVLNREGFRPPRWLELAEGGAPALAAQRR